MPREKCFSRSIDGDDDVIAFLSAIAGRKRHAIEPIAGASAVAVGGIGENTKLSFPVAAFAEAQSRGWIAAQGNAGRFKMTRSGREALRRHRSCLVATKANAGVAAATPAPGVNLKESPLTWLASRRDASGRPMLNRWEVEAGERLRADLTFAQLMPRITMGWSGIPMGSGRARPHAGGHDLTDNIVAARTRVTVALRAVGPEFSDILIDVCGHLRGLEEIARSEGWPRRAARLLLQRALSALARHYGIAPEVPIEQAIARRLRHWGSDDYRPSLDRWRTGGGQTD
jgi:hypothetical protein